MINLRVIFGNLNNEKVPRSGALQTIVDNGELLVEGNGLLHRWDASSEDSFLLFGDIFGVRSSDGLIEPSSMLSLEREKFESPNDVKEIEGRFVVLWLRKDGSCKLWTDQFGRIDLYWQTVDGATVCSTEIDLLVRPDHRYELDTVGLVHSLTIPGFRPAKQHTLYKAINRLGVNQILCFERNGIRIENRKVNLVSTEPQYTASELNRYAEYLLEAVRARGSTQGNIVYLSSGWDSTAILAILVYLFGPRKVRAIIGCMKYSERSAIINQFEIDRAKAVASYYGVDLAVVDFDYRTDASTLVDKVKEKFRSQQFYSLTGLNHWILAEAAKKLANGNEVIFAGEMSDGAHNLGFSQFTSIFHPRSNDFREYSDKMSAYLFGPTFYEALCQGEHDKDPVWNIFKDRNSQVIFEDLEKNPAAISRQLFSSFFLRSKRLPLYSLENLKMLTNKGREHYSTESHRIYFSEICSRVTPRTLYSAYLQLYNSFHWQGGTVATLEYTAKLNDLTCALPFNDSYVIEFLAAMPESWGRGLDLNPTKHPLKWMLRKKIRYPHHLQTGPHSYTYDVDPSFSLLGEILNFSSFRSIFTEVLREGNFLNRLDESVFNSDYIVRELVEPYLSGENLVGQKMTDLLALSMHSCIGVYK